MFAIQWAHGLASGFVYDAAQYWAASVALVSGGNTAEAGVLQLRGALTAIVYVPPALLSELFGPDSAAWTVLLWNSLMAAALCVGLLPRIAALISPGASAWRVWIAALAGGVIVSGFSRFALLDVWAIALALLGLYAIAVGSRWWHGALAGLALVFATNIRPAYLAPVLIATLVLLIAHPKSALWAIPGALLGLVPQIVFNLAVMDRLSLVPVQTPYLLNVQATYATFATRYDTVLEPGRYPSQFYCDPAYAVLQLDDTKPTSAPGVLISVLSHLPDSIAFLSGKVAASLHWSFSTPYEHSPGPGTSLMTLFIIAVSAGGLVALIWRMVNSWAERKPRIMALAVLGFWVGAVGTLVLSTPETRFAVPLAMIGLIGLLAAVPSPLRLKRPNATTLIAAAVAVAVMVGLFALGKASLIDPMPPGNVPTLETCAEWSSAPNP